MILISMRCPECGAKIDYEDGQRSVRCEYCDGVFFLKEDPDLKANQNKFEEKQEQRDSEFSWKYGEKLDPGPKGEGWREYDTNQDRNHNSRKQSTGEKLIRVIVLIAAAVFIVRAFIWFGLPALLLIPMWKKLQSMLTGEASPAVDPEPRVKAPANISSFNGKDYRIARDAFTNLGFTNVLCHPLNDLRFGVLDKPDTVESITIDGVAKPFGGVQYSPNVPVVISYHCYKQ